MPRRTQYRKLVRDRIPEIIERNGEESVTRILSTAQFDKALKEKFIEESGELKRAKTKKQIIEELADVLELVDSLAETHGIPRYAIERAQREKKRQRGGFTKRIYLISTTK